VPFFALLVQKWIERREVGSQEGERKEVQVT